MSRPATFEILLGFTVRHGPPGADGVDSDVKVTHERTARVCFSGSWGALPLDVFLEGDGPNVLVPDAAKSVIVSAYYEPAFTCETIDDIEQRLGASVPATKSLAPKPRPDSAG